MRAYRTKIRLVAVIGAVAALGAFTRPAAADTPVPFPPLETGALGGTSETYVGLRDDGSYYDPSLGRRACTVDGQLCDATKVATPRGRLIVDDWFRDSAKVPAGQTNPGLVDHRFRDASKVSVLQPSPNGFNWGDFGIGAAAMLGLMLLVTGVGLRAFAARHRGGHFRIS